MVSPSAIARTLRQDGFWHGERRVSERFEPGQLAGYPNDLRAKTGSTGGPTHSLGVPLVDFPGIGFRLHPVTVCQVALGWHERWLEERSPEALERFLSLAGWLIAHQRPWRGGGAWPIDVTYHSPSTLRAPWVSSLVQGQAISVLARAARLRPSLAASAERAMEAAFVLFERDAADGGVRCEDACGVAFEEYPTERPTIVLNGLISSLWGLADLAIVQGDGPARRLYDAATAALLRRLPRYDLGFWSRYCLHPHPLPNTASPYYHRAHLGQLAAMARLTPDPRWDETRARWLGYQRSLACRALALGAKAAFRLARSYEVSGHLRLFDRSSEFEAGPDDATGAGGDVRDRG